MEDKRELKFPFNPPKDPPQDITPLPPIEETVVPAEIPQDLTSDGLINFGYKYNKDLNQWYDPSRSGSIFDPLTSLESPSAEGYDPRSLFIGDMYPISGFIDRLTKGYEETLPVRGASWLRTQYDLSQYEVDPQFNPITEAVEKGYNTAEMIDYFSEAPNRQAFAVMEALLRGERDTEVGAELAGGHTDLADFIAGSADPTNFLGASRLVKGGLAAKVGAEFALGVGISEVDRQLRYDETSSLSDRFAAAVTSGAFQALGTDMKGVKVPTVNLPDMPKSESPTIRGVAKAFKSVVGKGWDKADEGAGSLKAKAAEKWKADSPVSSKAAEMAKESVEYKQDGIKAYVMEAEAKGEEPSLEGLTSYMNSFDKKGLSDDVLTEGGDKAIAEAKEELHADIKNKTEQEGSDFASSMAGLVSPERGQAVFDKWKERYTSKAQDGFRAFRDRIKEDLEELRTSSPEASATVANFLPEDGEHGFLHAELTDRMTKLNEEVNPNSSTWKARSSMFRTRTEDFIALTQKYKEGFLIHETRDIIKSAGRNVSDLIEYFTPDVIENLRDGADLILEKLNKNGVDLKKELNNGLVLYGNNVNLSIDSALKGEDYYIRHAVEDVRKLAFYITKDRAVSEKISKEMERAINNFRQDGKASWSLEDYNRFVKNIGFDDQSGSLYNADKVESLRSILNDRLNLRREEVIDAFNGNINIGYGRTADLAKKTPSQIKAGAKYAYNSRDKIARLAKFITGSSAALYRLAKDLFRKRLSIDVDKWVGYKISKKDGEGFILNPLRKENIGDVSARKVNKHTAEALGLAGDSLFLKATGLTRGITPGIRLATTSSNAIATVAEKLIQSPFLRNKNKAGEASAITAESLTRIASGFLSKAIVFHKENYSTYALEAGKRGEEIMDKLSFDMQVGRAMANGDKSHVAARDGKLIGAAAQEFITKDAVNFRTNLYDPLTEEAQKVGLLETDLVRKVADSYLNRIYDLDKIIERETEFRIIVDKYFRDKFFKDIIPEEGNNEGLDMLSFMRKDFEDDHEAVFAYRTLSEDLKRKKELNIKIKHLEKRNPWLKDNNPKYRNAKSVESKEITPKQRKILFTQNEYKEAKRELSKLKSSIEKKNKAIEPHEKWLKAEGSYDILIKAKEVFDSGDYDTFNEIIQQLAEDATNSVINAIKGNENKERMNRGSIRVRGINKDVTFNIKDELIEDFLVRDIDLVSRKFARTLGGEVALAKAFGTTDFQEVKKKMIDLHNRQLDEIRAAYGDDPFPPDPKDLIDKVNTFLFGTDGKPLSFSEANEMVNKDFRQGLEDLAAMWDLVRGTYHQESSPDSAMRRGLDTIRTINYISMLGGVVLSSLADLVVPAMIHGAEHTTTMRLGIKALRGQLGLGVKAMKGRIGGNPESAPLINEGVTAVKYTKDMMREAAEFGIATDIALNSRASAMFSLADDANRAKRSWLENRMAIMSEHFSKWSGIMHWNTYIRTSAYMTVSQRITRIIMEGESFNHLNKNDVEYLSQAGISEDYYYRLSDQLDYYGEVVDIEDMKVHKANSDLWHDRGAADLWGAILAQEVDRATIVPGAGDLPLHFRSDLGKLISQFNSYTVIAHQKILLSGLQRRNKEMLTSILFLLSAGLLSSVLKDAERFNEPDRDAEFYIKKAIDLSGLATLPVWMYDRTNDILGGENGRTSEGEAAVRFFGPTAGTLMHVSGAIRGETDDMRALIPFNNVSGIRILFDTLFGIIGDKE